jgi:hypothetical protein
VKICGMRAGLSPMWINARAGGTNRARNVSSLGVGLGSDWLRSDYSITGEELDDMILRTPPRVRSIAR